MMPISTSRPQHQLKSSLRTKRRPKKPLKKPPSHQPPNQLRYQRSQPPLKPKLTLLPRKVRAHQLLPSKKPLKKPPLPKLPQLKPPQLSSKSSETHIDSAKRRRDPWPRMMKNPRAATATQDLTQTPTLTDLLVKVVK